MNTPLLNAPSFKKAMPDKLILDIRVQDIFERGFIPGAYNIAHIGLNEHFDYWMSHLVHKDRNILLVTAKGKEEEGFNLLKELGYLNVTGVLEDGMESWINAGFALDIVISITPEELLMDLNFLKETEFILDVRNIEEQDESKLENALYFPLEQIFEKAADLNKKHTYYLYCSGGYRSMIAASILRSMGFNIIKNVYGGYTRIAKENEKHLGETSA